VTPGNDVLRYLAILRAARDLGLAQRDIEAVAGRFDARRPRCDELAGALAELLLARRPLTVPG
jgi:hypothetical protein